jgi:hypothetical protein
MRVRSDSARHKYVPPVRSLITFSALGSGSASVKFRVPIPDSRLRVKISVLFIPVAGNAPTSGVGGTLWLYEADDDQSGVSGMSIGCTNIEGTQASPTAIPAASPLLGYSREFVSAGDAIEGVLAATSGGAMIGTWVLQVRYQPDAVRFTDEEWIEIRNLCNPTLITPRVVV